MAKFTWPANLSRVFINGIEIKLLQDVTGEDMYGLEKVSGIGDIKGVDLVPSEATFRVTLGGYVEQNTKLISAGIWAGNAEEVLDGKEMTVELFQKNPAVMLKKWEEAKVESGTVTLTAHRQLMLRMTMQALDTSGTLTA